MLRQVQIFFLVVTVAYAMKGRGRGRRVETTVAPTQEIMDVQVGELPWTVAIRRQADHSFTCTASLIDACWVLTAAHCLGTISTYEVNMGSLQWASDGVVSTVTQQQIFPHEDYDTRTRENDIALMKLQDCVTSSATILPIALASRNSLYEGAEATASGWGTTSDSSASSSTNMHKIVIPVLSNRVCRSRSLNGIRIFNSMLCAGTDALTLCTGDSGGPLAFFENDGTATLIGVTSFGLSSCDEPAVYSRVTEHEDWIAGVMRDNS